MSANTDTNKTFKLVGASTGKAVYLNKGGHVLEQAADGTPYVGMYVYTPSTISWAQLYRSGDYDTGYCGVDDDLVKVIGDRDFIAYLVSGEATEQVEPTPTEEGLVPVPEAEGGSIDQVLAERGGNYGDFRENSLLIRNLKRIVEEHIKETNLDKLEDHEAEALDMIFHKIGRIVCGNRAYKDSWTDIAGYATLVANTKDD